MTPDTMLYVLVSSSNLKDHVWGLPPWIIFSSVPSILNTRGNLEDSAHELLGSFPLGPGAPVQCYFWQGSPPSCSPRPPKCAKMKSSNLPLYLFKILKAKRVEGLEDFIFVYVLIQSGDPKPSEENWKIFFLDRSRRLLVYLC